MFNLVKALRTKEFISRFPCRLKMSASAQVVYKVQHDLKKKQFYIELNNEAIGGSKVADAVLDYEYINDHTVDLYHTEVPPQMQGKGIAQLLARAALDFVTEKNLKMKLSCWYLQGYVNKNPLPEHTSRVVKD